MWGAEWRAAWDLNSAQREVAAWNRWVVKLYGIGVGAGKDKGNTLKWRWKHNLKA